MSPETQAPASRTLIVGTAGHIDHGKTVLVKALTGIDADRLPEEKRRGITIDLGFASTAIPGEDGSPVSLSFIDVPGHRLFVRNMLAGAGGIDCVMLVISAEDGVMPQTEEHLAICALLGITRGLVALTKTDLVTVERLAEVRREVEEFLSPSFLCGSPLVAVSVFTGEGLAELRRQLTLLAAHKPVRNQTGQMRLPLDRAFVVKGFGTVVTGTLQSGSLVRGEALLIEPGGMAVKARGLQIHGQSQHQAIAGSRVAVNLNGVEVGDVHRGATLVRTSSLTAVETIDAELTLLPGAPELRHRARVRFHCFSSESVATVLLYRNRALQAGETGLARLRLATPVVLLPADRFVLRRLSPAQTIGGGRVLDAAPLPKQRRKDAFAWLSSLEAAAADRQIALRVARRGASGLTIDGLARELGWTKQPVSDALRPLIDSGEITAVSADLLLSRQSLSAAQFAIVEQVGRLAGKSSHAAGIRRAELRSRARLPAEVFDSVISALVAQKKLRAGGDGESQLIAPYESAVGIPESDRLRMAEIASAYESAGLQAPLFAEVIARVRLREPEARRLMTLLLRSKTLIKLGADDLFMHQKALAALREQISKLHGHTIDVPRFKQITGLSRKYAIPLLEYLDREHLTRRQGESRLVL